MKKGSLVFVPFPPPVNLAAPSIVFAASREISGKVVAIADGDTLTILTEDKKAVLQNALTRCREEDVRTVEVYAALDFLAARAAYQWPLDRFREALDNEASDGGWQSEGRGQILNASFNGIRLALAGAKEPDHPTKAKPPRAFR